MKRTVKTAMVLLALTASAWMATAQDNNGPQADRPPRREGPGGPGGAGGPRNFNRDGQRPPVPPLMAVLDANHDGVIDDVEIANASAALKKLDRNGDGRLTLDELRPPRMEDMGGPGGPDGLRAPGHRAGLNGPGGPGNPRGPQARRPDGAGGQSPPDGERPPLRPQPEN